MVPEIEIGQLLSCGGQACVYSASLYGQPVVLKCFDDRAVADKEALILARLDHPNIIKDLGAWHDGDRYGRILEYGGPFTLRALLNDLADRGAFLSVDVINYFAESLGSALAFIHRCGLYHNDLSPSNILLDLGGEIKIGDFGAASLVGEKRVKAAFGKREYLAPEILWGDAPSAAADIYSLAMILTELATGEVIAFESPAHGLRRLKDRLFHRHTALYYWLVACLAPLAGFRAGLPYLPKSNADECALAQSELVQSLIALVDAKYAQSTTIYFRQRAEDNNAL